MTVDAKNILRLDVEDILNECRRQSLYAIRPYTAREPGIYHPDDYAISANEIEQVLSFCMDGAAKIADFASMVKHHTQTGLDALTYHEDFEKPAEADSFDEDADTFTTPDGREDEPLANVMGMVHASGQKLEKGMQDLVLFEVTDLENDQLRYTVVQQHIKTALVNYVLHKWWSLVGLNDLAAKYLMDFNEAIEDVRHNSPKNHARKRIVRKTRPSV